MTINEPDAEDGQQEPNPAADRQLPECSGSPAVPDLSYLDREADAAHESAVYLVPTIDDADALDALGFEAQLAGAPAAVEHAAAMLRGKPTRYW